MDRLDRRILLRGNETRIRATEEVPNIYATQPVTVAQLMHLGENRRGDVAKPMDMPDLSQL